jgi:SAM-dependent methyltransferase
MERPDAERRQVVGSSPARVRDGEPREHARVLELLEGPWPASPPSASRRRDRLGILAIAAARLGAVSVTGLDLDPDAVEAARANAARNGLADRVTVEPEVPRTGPVRRPRSSSPTCSRPRWSRCPGLGRCCARPVG